MKNRFIIFILLIATVTVIFGASKVIRYSRISEAAAGAEEGVFRHAADFTLLDIDGNERKLSDFKGKVIILDFWATWCPPCRAEIPHFIELYNEYKDKGLEVIGVSLDRDGGKAVSDFAGEYRINYTVLLGDRDVSGLYGGIVSIPTTFVIDRESRIRKKYIGYREKKVFEKDVEELL